MGNLTILEKAATALGRVRTAYDAPLLKSLGVDYLGRTLPMGAQPYGTGLASWLGHQGDALSASGYTNHGTAYSIVSYILTTAVSIPWNAYALDKADNKANPKPGHRLAALLYRPNVQQSFGDFMTAACGGLLLHGEVFIRKTKPLAGSKAGTTDALDALPAPCVELIGPNGMPGQLGRFEQPTYYRYTDPATGRWTDYPAEEIIHLKYWNPSDPHRGLSPVSAGVDALTAGKAGLTSRVTQYQNQGPPGVIYDESSPDPWTDQQKNGVHNWFNSFRAGGRRSGQMPILGGKLGFLKLGLSPVDMDVLAAIPHDKDAIADLWHFPGQLLNGSKGTTFSNMGEAGAALYSRCVIPLLSFIRDGLNRGLGEEYKDGVYLDFDVSGVAELQPNKEKLAQWLATAWWISVQDKQRMMGVAVDEKLPKYFIPAGVVPADSIGKEPTEVE